MNKEKQSVKRRIFISNTYMVLVILCLFLVVNIVVIKLYERTYKYSLVNSTEMATHSEPIKSLLSEWALSTEEEAINKLATQLDVYDAFLSVELDGQFIYSNTDFSMEEFNKEIGQFLNEDGKLHIYVQNYMTLLTKYDPTEKIKVVVLTGDYQEFLLQKNSYTDLLILIIIDGIFGIGVLLIVSQFFTKKLIKHILEPLDALSEGAERMKAGNLSEEVRYKGDVEFENVCDAFNQMQAHTKEVNEEKEVYEKARIEMVAGISHDLRTPLTAIRGTIKGIQDGIASTPELRDEFLDIAYRRAIDMNHLLERLFYFSKLETGNMPLNFEVIEWREYLETYVRRFEMLEDNTSIKLKLVEVEKGISSNIDREQFKRILDNLLENSKKYADTDNIEVVISTVVKGSDVVIEVSDNGSGVSDDMISRIFEQFFRGDASRQEKEGNGLGLYIVKYLVEQMAGTVTAENRNGFTVKIRLPITREGDGSDE